MTPAAKLEKGSRRGATAAVAAFAGEGGCKRKKLLAFFGEHRWAHLPAHCMPCRLIWVLGGGKEAAACVTGRTAGLLGTQPVVAAGAPAAQPVAGAA